MTFLAWLHYYDYYYDYKVIYTRPELMSNTSQYRSYHASVHNGLTTQAEARKAFI